tara:strand:- start:364 stop:651 length:288 start_codon:yes stop_codon:yes gene_type:complete
MELNKESLKDYRLHAITVLTGASAALSQIEALSQYSPIAAGLAFLISASTYGQIMNRVEDLIEDLEEAGLIDEETADKLDSAAEVVEDVVESLQE